MRTGSFWLEEISDSDRYEYNVECRYEMYHSTASFLRGTQYTPLL